MKLTHKKQKRGFTLIEVMIATALFVVVIITGVGVLLNVNRSHKTTEIIRTALDSLGFVMEDMSRNIRLGSNIHCFVSGDSSSVETPVSCPSSDPSSGIQGSLKLALEGMNGKEDSTLLPSGVSDQIVYSIQDDSTGIGNIKKSMTGDGAVGSTYKKITPVDIDIDLTKSGFTVIGAEPYPLDGLQPRVIIRLVGTLKYQSINLPFDLQTTVTPRYIDS